MSIELKSDGYEIHVHETMNDKENSVLGVQ